MIYIILAMLLYSVTILLGTAASRSANTNLVSAITNTISALLPIAVVIPILSKKTIVDQKVGIIYAVLGGLTVALFVMSLNKAFSVNKVAIVSPIVFGGAILLTTVASYFIFKEKVSLVQGVGLTLLLVGLGLVIYARATGK